MERELFFVNEAKYDLTKLEMEIETIKKLLSHLESFSSFVATNDICDIRNQTFLKNHNKIRQVLEEGLDCTTRYYVFCKN
ncbi:MAG: hypothetical protein ABIN01_22950 [Ferruginibacter sp.]